MRLVWKYVKDFRSEIESVRNVSITYHTSVNLALSYHTIPYTIRSIPQNAITCHSITRYLQIPLPSLFIPFLPSFPYHFPTISLPFLYSFHTYLYIPISILSITFFCHFPTLTTPFPFSFHTLSLLFPYSFATLSLLFPYPFPT